MKEKDMEGSIHAVYYPVDGKIFLKREIEGKGIIKTYSRKHLRNFPGGPVVKALARQGMQVRSLVEELRSHMPQSTEPTNHNEDPVKPKFKERKEDISELRAQVSESCRVPHPVKEPEPPCDIQTPRRADHDGFQRKDSRSHVGQEPEQCPAQGAGGQCRQDTQRKLFLPCRSHLSRQKQETG